MKARLAAFIVVLSMTGAAREAAATIGNTPPGEALTISNTGSPNFTQGATGCTSTSVSFNSNSFVTCNSGAWAVQPVQIGTASSAPFTCSSTYAGMMYENSGTNTIQYCNGSIWTSIGAGGGSLSGSGSTGYDAIWTSPTAIGTGLLFESGGKVGIGTTSPAFPLNVATTITAGTTGAMTYANGTVGAPHYLRTGALAQVSAVPSATLPYTLSINGVTGIIDMPSTNANTGGWPTGLFGLVTNESTVAGNNAIGLVGEAYNTGNIGALIGANAYAESDSGTTGAIWGAEIGVDIEGGTASYIEGTYVYADVDGGTPGAVYGVDSEPAVFGGSTGAIYGVYVIPYIDGGTATNRYGVYIDDGGGAATTDDFGLYQVATYQKNYFGGKVGIGITNPLYLLQTATSDSSGGYFDINGTSHLATLGLRGNQGNNWWQMQANASSALNFANNNSGITALTLLSSGNVGIGTPTPGYNLQVNGIGYFTGLLYVGAGTVDGSTSGDNSLDFTAPGGLRMLSTVYLGATYNGGSPTLSAGGSGNQDIIFGSNTTPRAVVAATGSVGIGTTSPLATLDVRGLVAANGHISNGTTFTIASGCGTPTTLTGGATTGSFKAGQTACAPVITLPTAPHGWWCQAWDITTTADTLKMTADTTASCTLSGTVVASDVIVFHAEAF